MGSESVFWKNPWETYIYIQSECSAFLQAQKYFQPNQVNYRLKLKYRCKNLNV